MKITVITGSPHKNGTSARLAEEFIKGAESAGHKVFRFDGAFKNVHPCIACEKCHKTNSGCAFKDDMQELDPHLLESDGIVFVSPIYYYDVTAQIKRLSTTKKRPRCLSQWLTIPKALPTELSLHLRERQNSWAGKLSVLS